jgi:hypothetical protein
MAIRMKNFDLNSEFAKRGDGKDLGIIAAGVTTKTIFVAPFACVVESVDFYNANAFSANTSDTIQFRVFQAGASGSTDKTLQVMTISTSAATNAYTANSRIRITPSANNSLTVGTQIVVQISSVCQTVLSQTFCHVVYKPLLHRESR